MKFLSPAPFLGSGLLKQFGIFMFACLSFALRADTWVGLEQHYSGPKLTASDLSGKVVMGMCWGANHPPSRVLLPQMERLWLRLKDKPFVFVASSRQGCADRIEGFVKNHNLTFPIYERFGLPQFERIGIHQGDPNLPLMPFFFVVDHCGSLVYSGRDMKEASGAALCALAGTGGGVVSLTGKVELKAYKSMEKQLVFGKKIKDVVEKLQADVKRGAKSDNPAAKTRAHEASAILEAIEMGKATARAEINFAKKKAPEKALKLIKDFSVTFPADAEEFKADIPVLTAEAKKKSKR